MADASPVRLPAPGVVRSFAWSAALREAAWPALAVLSAGLATWLEARLALWLTARREEAARRG